MSNTTNITQNQEISTTNSTVSKTPKTIKKNQFGKIVAYSIFGIGLLSIGIGAVSVSAHGGMMNNDAAITALKNRDIEAFKKAIVDNATTRANNLTQEKFDQLATQANKLEAVQKAIEDKNYNDFKANANQRLLKKVNSQDDFDKFVERVNTEKTNQDKINEAIKNNDFNAYKAAMQARKDDMKNLLGDKMGGRGRGKHDGNHVAPTDDQIKAHFDEQVAQYKADGTLPDAKSLGISGRMGMMGGKGMREGMSERNEIPDQE
jgi:hypothetical protein